MSGLEFKWLVAIDACVVENRVTVVLQKAQHERFFADGLCASITSRRKSFGGSGLDRQNKAVDDLRRAHEAASLLARTPVFTADPRNIRRARNPWNRSVLFRLCGNLLRNLNAFFLLAGYEEQCESYCYVTHGLPPAFDYTPEDT